MNLKLLGVAAVMAAMFILTQSAYATPSGSSSGESGYNPVYWSPNTEFGETVKVLTPGQSFSVAYQDFGGGYTGYYSATRKVAGVTIPSIYFKKSSGGSYYVTYGTESQQSFTTVTAAEKYLDQKLIKLFSGVANSNGSSNAMPKGSLHTSINETISVCIAPMVQPRSQWKDSGQLKKTANIMDEVERQRMVKALGNGPASQISWNTSANSSLRYEHRWFDNSDAEYNRFGGTLRTGWAWDRVSLDVMMPLDRADYNGSYDFADYTRIGLIATPRFSLITQEEKGIDLTAGVSMFYFHTFLDENDGDRSDPDHCGIGPFFAIQKDFKNVVVNGGFIWQRGFNMDGENEITGDGEVDVYKVAMNVGVPIGNNFVLNTNATYSYTADMPSYTDDDFLTVGIGGSWVIKDKWNVDLSISRDFCYDESDNLEFTFGLMWQF
jgi:hypothetical protein